MKSTQILVMLVVPTLLGCSSAQGPYREFNPPWLTASSPEVVEERLNSVIHVGMARNEIEAKLRRNGVKNWSHAPAVYRDYIGVQSEINEPAFRYIGEDGGVPFGEKNYAISQPDRIAITVPCYRGVPKRGFIIDYTAPVFGVATITFNQGHVVSSVYEPLSGHNYSIRQYEQQMSTE